jgi:hypothetical protein
MDDDANKLYAVGVVLVVVFFVAMYLKSILTL